MVGREVDGQHHFFISGVGEVRVPAAPTGKSFRFVRAYERASGRASHTREINSGYLDEFAECSSSSSSSLFSSDGVWLALISRMLRCSLPKTVLLDVFV